MISNKDLCIVIVSYNTKALVLACLNSIYQHVKCSFEIVVVDNGSQDGSLEALEKYQKNHSHFKIVSSASNLGFGKANNLGVNQTRADYILFLNSDTLLTQDCISPLLLKFKTDSSLGLGSVKLLNKDGSVQNSGGAFPNLGNLLAWQFGLDDLPILNQVIRSFHPHLDKIKLTNYHPDWVTGAFMMVPRDVFTKVGGFDEQIFMYAEELELAYRIYRLGFKTIFLPTFELIHYGGASGGASLALVSEVRGIVFFFRKHYPKSHLPYVLAILRIGSLLRVLFFGIIKPNEQARRIYWEAFRLAA